MPSEPSWSKQISNSSVCTWFFNLAILNGIFGAAGVLSAVYLMSKGVKGSSIEAVLVVMAALVAFTNSWFLFLVCNRGLKA